MNPTCREPHPTLPGGRPLSVLEWIESRNRVQGERIRIAMEKADPDATPRGPLAKPNWSDEVCARTEIRRRKKR